MSLLDFISRPVPMLRVAMMGPRGAGKTTILTSIFSNAVQDFAPVGLFLRGREGSPGAALLNARHNELASIFTNRGDISGVTATGEEVTYEFELGVMGKKPSANVDIKDFPGEYLVKEKEKVNEFISQSDIIMIAIDTPYLVEADGQYNEEMNRVDLVTSFFKSNPDVVADKLVLLVPLKCEKYFRNGTIDDVTYAVEKAYRSLIEFFKQQNIACAVTPIQTLGDMAFDCFVANERGVGVSQVARYRFVGDKPRYCPMFCVQPMYYLLSYAARHHQWSKTHNNDNFFERLKRTALDLIFNDKDYYHASKSIAKFMLTDTNGFKIVTRNTIWSTQL